MAEQQKKSANKLRIEVSAMEADKAFFDARLSFADAADDTAYQKAQKKAYEILGKSMSEKIDLLKEETK